MKIERIHWHIWRIYDVVNQKQLEELELFIKQQDFKRKNSTSYACSVWKIDYKNEYFHYLGKLLKLKTLQKWVEKIFQIPLQISDQLEVVQIQKWDFLSEHIDDYNSIQWVFHCNTLQDVNWWLLHVNGVEIPPVKNSFVFFPWKTPHLVSHYSGKQPRYSISVWYQKQV